MPVGRRAVGLSPLVFFSNALIWISAVVVMGIISYFISQANGGPVPTHIIYEEVIAVLTVAFFLFAFFVGAFPGFFLLFNLIFSYLWLVSVVFTAEDWSYTDGALVHTVEAFSFIAFFLLFFNVLYDWHVGYVGGAPTTSVV